MISVEWRWAEIGDSQSDSNERKSIIFKLQGFRGTAVTQGENREDRLKPSLYNSDCYLPAGLFLIGITCMYLL